MAVGHLATKAPTLLTPVSALRVHHLLALDLSLTASGVADPSGDVFTLKPPKGTRGGERLSWWHQTFVVLLDQHAPQRVVVESPYVGHRNNTLALGELYGVFRLALAEAGRPFVVTWVPPKSLKKRWAGTGNASKDDMRRAAVERCGDVGELDDNGVDALALWVGCQAGWFDE